MFVCRLFADINGASQPVFKFIASTQIRYFQEINKFVKFSLQQPQFFDQYCISFIHIFSGKYIVIYVHQSCKCSTTINFLGVAARFGPTNLLFHYVSLSWKIIFVSFAHVICSGKNKLSNYLKLLSTLIPGSYFLIVRRHVVSGVYINCKGMVTFL